VRARSGKNPDLQINYPAANRGEYDPLRFNFLFLGVGVERAPKSKIEPDTDTDPDTDKRQIAVKKPLPPYFFRRAEMTGK
jgi:hypothetical protein